jgi:hypothetical protein
MMTIAERHYLKGKKDGYEKGAKTILLKQLRTRFGELPKTLEAKIHSASPERLEDCLIAIFGFRSLEDARKWWN